MSFQNPVARRNRPIFDRCRAVIDRFEFGEQHPLADLRGGYER